LRNSPDGRGRIEHDARACVSHDPLAEGPGRRRHHVAEGLDARAPETQEKRAGPEGRLAGVVGGEFGHRSRFGGERSQKRRRPEKDTTRRS
jgi:hypothetical protein